MALHIYMKGLFVSESDVLNKRKKEHAKERMTCAVPFLLLQIHLLSSKNNLNYLNYSKFSPFVQKFALRLKIIVFVLKFHSENSSTVNLMFRELETQELINCEEFRFSSQCTGLNLFPKTSISERGN